MLRKMLMLGALLLLPSAALGWNDFGHMTVAEVAFQELGSDPALAKAIALIKRNPRFGAWTNGVAAADRDEYAFLRAATWPDELRDDNQYRDDKIGDPDSSQTKAYAELSKHRFWHFSDKPFSTDGTPFNPKVPAPNAATQIALFRTALRPGSGASDDVRSYDLVWLMHLIGDVHQPLHAVTRVSKASPQGDFGGNSVIVPNCKCFKEKLHAFWDDRIGSDRNTSADQIEKIRDRARVARGQADRRAALIADEKAWLEESFALANTIVYRAPIMEGNGPYELTPDYIKDANIRASKRVGLAGLRLAELIRAALKD